MEGNLCRGHEVIVVGGGNSAGQAAMFLSRTATMVHLLVRADGLETTMSSYLIERIRRSARVTLHTRSEIVSMSGDDHLEEVTCRHRDTGALVRHPVSDVFVMIGADPNTAWLGECVGIDAKGFVVTGRQGDGQAMPSPYATTQPGVFAVGDVRAGSIKRVASGVGEGSAVIQAVHAYLATVSDDNPSFAKPENP
jgi:thioredoxin reductase (NADPH)